MCHLTRLCSRPLLIHLACVFSKICFHAGDIRRAFISREHEKSQFSKHSNASRHFGTVITFPLTFCRWCAMWSTKRKVDNKLIIAFKTVQQRWGAQSAHRQLFSSHLLNKTSGWAHANGWQRLLCFAQTNLTLSVFSLFFSVPRSFSFDAFYTSLGVDKLSVTCRERPPKPQCRESIFTFPFPSGEAAEQTNRA